MKINNKPTLINTFILGLTLFTASFTSQAQLNIITTTGMIADLAQNIGGKHVKATSLMGTGVDPHLYKATQGDLRRLTRADIIFYNGLHLEGKMQEIFEKLARKKTVVAVGANIDQNKLMHHGSYPDPHIWFDLSLWQQAGQRVLETLQEQDPKHKADYQNQADEYLKQMAELDSWIKQQILEVPENQRILITAHDAFGYFGKAYDIKVMGLQGISTAAEFGLQDIKKLKNVIVKNNVKAVFVESSVSPRFIESLVAGVTAEGHKVVIGGELYSDAMGPQGTPTDNYFGMVKHNVQTIVNALRQ
ncbi:metal ABC transporter solute-binding protein, Zn/Mn family [Thiomicrorhabdus lithotrophica]|uniref:Zinc ABC transporter substrate-binding protein n=1 Tax=Thiomicrorhabdus lithotrophica TaxID=2949997 RepID=A0ABY8C9K7_9GAMM|nr:zinc ABC transporter substrate-binding protein [Thiomicrorhabdus lithotrophica]WEJ61922.1 zinc ABC transporter substrate-binding protein [Thiomicrorhabdus lithotrophica]